MGKSTLPTEATTSSLPLSVSPPMALADTASIRDAVQAREAQLHSPWAANSATQGQRSTPELLCSIRTPFQRDRDRILHSKAFRRLSHKTQVFISPKGDHYRTRLTHSLEVSQISRTIARALGLNEDLTEAIALGHDLGHPPFGHSGEAALSAAHKASGYTEGFHHERQSVRIVTELEPLNLTVATLEGMGAQLNTTQPKTLEAQLVKVADRMTYLHHDVEDAVRAGMMVENDIPTDIISVLGDTRKQRLDTLVVDVITQTEQSLRAGTPAICQTPTHQTAMNRLRKWMFDSIYLSAPQQAQQHKVQRVITSLYTHYCANPSAMPPHFTPQSDHPAQTVVDFIAGMTDRFAIETYQTELLPLPYISKRDMML